MEKVQLKFVLLCIINTRQNFNDKKSRNLPKINKKSIN